MAKQNGSETGVSDPSINMAPRLADALSRPCGLGNGAHVIAVHLRRRDAVVGIGFDVDGDAVRTRVEQDPFVMHGVVTAELHAVTPSRLAAGMAELLGRSHPASTPA